MSQPQKCHGPWREIESLPDGTRRAVCMGCDATSALAGGIMGVTARGTLERMVEVLDLETVGSVMDR